MIYLYYIASRTILKSNFFISLCFLTRSVLSFAPVGAYFVPSDTLLPLFLPFPTTFSHKFAGCCLLFFKNLHFIALQ